MRKHKLRCIKCYNKDWVKYEVWKNLSYKTWNNIYVESNTKESVKCTCNNCGHTYISRSKAAFRELRSKAEYNQNKE